MKNGATNYPQEAIQKWMACFLDPLTKGQSLLKRMVCFLDQLTRISFVLSGLALASIVLLILYEVTMRYFFNAPTNWSSDVNQWLFALTVMLALPEITREKGNVAITVLIEKLSHSKRVIVCRFIALLGASVCLAVCYIAGMECVRQYQAGITTTWINPIPKWWISLVIPVGFFLTGAQFLREAVSPHPKDET